MKRVIQSILLGSLCLVAPCVSAASLTHHIATTLQGYYPGWTLKPGGGIGPTLDYDYVNNRWWQAPPQQCQGAAACLTTTRTAPAAYAPDNNGNYTAYAANVFRPLIEETRTNDALWARDLTQAGTWIAVGTGTALNAVGIDGTANSATTLTASGTASSCTSSCTILQTITLGSTADTYSVFLKRVTGSGTVNITINNLSAVTACTLTTTAFTRCTVTATLANPVIGIQMTALNDVIVADFNQMEPGSFATSPIPTTTVAVVRAADVVTVKTVPTFGSAYTLYASATPETPTTNAANQNLLTIDDGTTNNRAFLLRPSATGTAAYNTLVANVSDWNDNSVAAWAVNVFGKIAASWATGAQAMSFNGATVVTTTGAIPAGGILNAVHIGVRPDNTISWNGTISRDSLFATIAVPNAGLVTVINGGGP